MDMTTLANPFHVWSELARGLRDRYVKEMGERPYSLDAEEVLNKLNYLISTCGHLGSRLKLLRDRDEKAYQAFLRALENS